MSILHSQQTQALINRLVSDEGNLPSLETEQFAEFVRHYFHGVPYEDLSERDLFDLRGVALAHRELGRVRKQGESKIRIYTPDVERDGWRSKHAVLEVVAFDRPFLVDSITMVLKEMGLKIHLSVHPVFAVKRNSNGELEKIASPLNADFLDGEFESFLHFQFVKPSGVDEINTLKARLLQTIQIIESAVMDWPVMRKRIGETARSLEQEMKRSKNPAMEDQAEFCNWLKNGNFTFLGYCEFRNSKSGTMRFNEKSRLGVLRKIDDIGAVIPVADFSSDGREQSLIITKANTHAPIHRASYMDLITIPKFSSSGKCTGLRVLVGLFSSTAYNGSANLIPLLRVKIKKVLQRSRFSETTHSIRALTNIIDNYPRDMLFRVSADELFEDVAGTLELQERQRIKVFLRREQYGRFYSAIVYVPQELFNRTLRVNIGDILMESLEGKSSDFFSTFSESVLARITYTIHVDKDSVPKRELAEIQQLVEDTTITWQDSLYKATIERYGEETGTQYFKNYENSFSASYQEDHSPWMTAADFERFARLGEDELIVSFYRPLSEASEEKCHLKLYCYGKQISPSDALPYLENMGLHVVEERPYEVRPKSGEVLWVHDFTVVHSKGDHLDPDQQRATFEEAFRHIWRGDAENDGFNRLVLTANLAWRQVIILRAYSRYLKQIGNPFSDSYITETLTRHVEMTVRLVEFFQMLFDPSSDSTDSQRNKILDQLKGYLDEITSLDEDVMMRNYVNVILSTIRTNFYRTDESGQSLSYLSFKIDASKILKMPDPRPKYEIFVYSTRTEAVHLRGGKVARGGLRWSDRREDFRTEVLGLVKAQMVKNAVIVPVGSKGGFVVKQPPPDGKSLLDEAIYCYSTFIRGMLDVTDNIVDNEIVSPPNVKCYDESDPYLVVAADKGTATFSDIANELADEYGFWLGDAFASGGSVGYDHKGMGITARGAWESVKRQFRELGTDIQTTDFTAIGIGDMSGDVFGNGMLLSRHIKLVGAFNHIEIFLDPNPDAAASYEERKRLFDNPGLTWKDYNKKLISKGGGVFDRTAKAIEISPEVQKRLHISESKLAPTELLNAMLKAPIDLLWNGGIGTYVKATLESHADAANRSNDLIRVNGSDLGCKVVGEGGNLGMTQLGRVEYCLNGGRCYTDFIDNSGGVDCSDHEVNIKILLNQIVNNGEMTMKQREQILRDMTDEVASLVLTDNYQQSQALSLVNANSKNLLQEHVRFIRELESSGDLDRQIEFLPDRDELKRRESERIGLKFPELSVLLAYSKMTLYQTLLASDVPEDPYLIKELDEYFPERLARDFKEEIHKHRLKREIVATFVTNNMVNRVGPTFALRMQQFTGAESCDVARAYCAAREIFQMQDVWKAIEDLDNRVAAQTQMTMLSFAGGLLERATLWLLRHRSLPIDVEGTVNYFKGEISKLSKELSKALTDQYTQPLNEHVRVLMDDQVPEPLARQIAELIPLSTAFDIVEIIKNSKKPMLFVTRVYFDVGARLDLMWIRQRVSMLPVENHWHSLAKSRLSDDIHAHQYAIASDVVREAKTSDSAEAVSEWMDSNNNGCRMLANIISDMKSISNIDFATLSVAISEVHLLGRASE